MQYTIALFLRDWAGFLLLSAGSELHNLFGFYMKAPIIILQFSCTDYALTMHQAICGMVEANGSGKMNKKTSQNLTIQLVFCAFHTKLWSEWQDLNLRPLPPQLTWVCPLVRFACFHAVSAPRHLLLRHFLSTVSACSAFVCGKNCGQTAFWADSGRGFVGRKKNRVFSAALKNP